MVGSTQNELLASTAMRRVIKIALIDKPVSIPGIVIEFFEKFGKSEKWVLNKIKNYLDYYNVLAIKGKNLVNVEGYNNGGDEAQAEHINKPGVSGEDEQAVEREADDILKSKPYNEDRDNDAVP